MATRKKPPVSPAGGGPARGRAIQPAPLRRITPPAPAGTNACSVPVKYWKRRCRLCCVLFGHSGRSTPQAANSGAGGRTHRAPRPGIGPLHGEETESGRRSGGNGSNGAADRLRTRAPRPGIGSLHGEETENGKRCGGNGSNRGSRSAAHPGTPTRNRTAQRREQGKRQTKRRRWQQRSCGGGRSIVRIRNGVKIMPPAEKRSFFLIFAP